MCVRTTDGQVTSNSYWGKTLLLLVQIDPQDKLQYYPAKMEQLMIFLQSEKSQITDGQLNSGSSNAKQ